jgi:dihydrofolate reductase
VRTVVLQVFELSLDGIIGEEGSEFFQYCRDLPDDPVYEEWLAASLARASLHIMGRVTYEGMARYFPTATGAIADVMNRGPRIVFSRTLRSADWAGTEIAGGDAAAELDKLRRQGSGEILVHGGASFVRSLASQDLADEYRLTVYPYAAGSGQRLFGDAEKPRAFELASSTSYAEGVVSLVYRRNRSS